jgi:cell division septum initiation protein DivIVA
MVGDEPPSEGENHTPAAPAHEHGFRELGHYVPRDLLDVSFPAAVRGYDRRAVDAHIKRVNQVIAELKVRASPPAAVRHALDQAGEKVEGLLQAAREAAEEITSSAREEAEESTDRAKTAAAKLLVNTSAEADRLKAEADELIANARAEAETTVADATAEASRIVSDAKAEAENTRTRSQGEADEYRRLVEEELAALRHEAETRMREVEADAEAIWKQRGEMLDDVRTLAGGLVDLADAAAARFQRREPAPPEAVATDEAARAVPAVTAPEGSDDEPRT